MKPYGMFLVLLGAALGAVVLGSPASAAPVMLEHNSSWARIDPYTQQGNDIWVVDGWNFLWKEWFWYRVDGPGGLGREASIDTLDPNPVVLASDTSGDHLNDNLRLIYRSADQGLAVEVNYNLMGGAPGSGRSDIADTILITNTGNVAKDVHFFLYADYILSAGFDTAVVPWPNTVDQSFLPWHECQAAVVPVPRRHEVNLVPFTLDALNDGLATTLNGNGGPLTGDVAWALEWEFSLAPGASYAISENRLLTMIPEPAALALLALGGLAIIRRRRRP
jgi:hypothetical protein